jgi:hypothetical protein
MRTFIAGVGVVAALLVQAPVHAASPSRNEDPSGHANAASVLAAPPVMVSVYVAPHIAQSLVTHVLAEASDVWRAAGVVFVWTAGAEEAAPYGRSGDVGRYQPSVLRVSIDYERGDVKPDALTVLGWIRFERPDEPDQVIHVSYANAESLLEKSELVVGTLSTMPALQREQYLSRAMGRALAHELGHYLLASKAHTTHGLMQTGRSASELFGRQRVHFDIDTAQKQTALSRLMQQTMLTRR